MGRNKGSDTGAVLISRFSALGDVAMAIPVVYDACRSNPRRLFVMLTKRHPATLFVNPPENLTVVGIDTDRYPGIGGMRRLHSELKEKYRFTTYVDLHDVLRTRLLRLFTIMGGGAKVRHINKGRRGKKALTRRRHKVLLQLTPTIRRYADVFRRAGIYIEPHFTSLYGNGKGDTASFAAVTPPKREDERWIAIASFARHAGKIYPPVQMKKVVETLAGRPNYRIFLLGAGENECRELEEWREESGKRVLNLAAAKLGIPGEIALLSHCDVMVSMDSANMHIASLVGLPAVTIWGATHPFTGFMGWKQSEKNAVQLDMVCRPCSVFGDKPCRYGDYHCLKGISPAQILERIDKLLLPLNEKV